MKYSLNSNQLAISMCAAHRLEQGEDRQLYSIPAGLGKSRVIVGIIAALSSNSNKKGTLKAHIHVVYNH